MPLLYTAERLTPKRLRIIDGLIAEHLLGWKWFSAIGDAFLIPPWRIEQARRFNVHWTEGLNYRCGDKLFPAKKLYDIDLHYSNYAHWKLPNFTTDKASAFEVLEEVAKRWVTAHIMFAKPYKPQWQLQTGAGNTLQLAICMYVLDRLDIKLPWKQKPKHLKKAASPKSAGK